MLRAVLMLRRRRWRWLPLHTDHGAERTMVTATTTQVCLAVGLRIGEYVVHSFEGFSTEDVVEVPGQLIDRWRTVARIEVADKDDDIAVL